mmetsp:Transcript_12304/g.18498  ORF Transcript_12304/g.18498 Transcript_12304/m.18498 type:complete len:425 (-) Transcript_12304:221-1495(-)
MKLSTIFCLMLSTFCYGLDSFSYNPRDPYKGPEEWGSLDTSGNEWQKYKELEVYENECKSEDRQSPIDLVGTAPCEDKHKILTKRGGCDFDTLKFYATPFSLRADFPTDGRCKLPTANPSNDTPRVKARHVEVKIPSEHRIHGKQFDGELSISHVRKSGRNIIMVSILLEAKSDRRASHPLLQQFINRWKMKQRADDYKCSRPEHSNDRNLLFKNSSSSTDMMLSNDTLSDNFGDESSIDDLLLGDNQTDRMLQHWGYRHQYGGRDPYGGRERPLTPYPFTAPYPGTTANFNGQNLRKGGEQRGRSGTSDFNVYHFVPTKYFYSYKGSLTVPPCSTIVDWHVMDKPLIISTRQLAQIQDLMRLSRGKDCERTSFAYKGEVNRPIQDLKGRKVTHCTDFKRRRERFRRPKRKRRKYPREYWDFLH